MNKDKLVVDKLLGIEEELNELFVERAEPIRGLLISALSGTNMLLLGGAGIAKSLLTVQWNRRITDGNFFSWLLNAYTTPEEVFGPPSFKGFQKEEYYRVTTRKLPEAETAFLDEIFKSNSAMLNTLLPILNERIFYNNGLPVKTPLLTVVGASNEIPDAEDKLEALFDRFLLKYTLQPIQESGNFAKMLLNSKMEEPPKITITVQELRQAIEEVNKVTMPQHTLEVLVQLREIFRRNGIGVSDRTYKIALRILKADAYLNKSETIENENLELFRHIAWNKPEQIKDVYGLILNLIAPEKQKIVALYDECITLSKKVYEQKDPVKRQNTLIEVNKKMRAAMAEIAVLITAMKEKNQDISKIVKQQRDLENLVTQMSKDVLAIAEKRGPGK